MDEQDKIAGRRASEAAAKAAAKVVKNPEFRGTATAVKKSSASVKPKAKPAAVAAKKVTATRMTRPGSSVKSTPKSSAPSAISGKKVSTTASKKTTAKKNTTSNPLTAAFNKLSPYGDKTQKFNSPVGKGLATKKSVKGKPSIGEQISGVFSGKSSGSKKTYLSVAEENAKRMGITVAEYNRRLNAAKKKK
jgi:hypothetical protein